jgi:hypothetical protein
LLLARRTLRVVIGETAATTSTVTAAAQLNHFSLREK